MKTTTAIGLMSGTSLDGVDLVCVNLFADNSFSIIATETIPYNDVWYSRLKHLHEQNAETFAKTNIYYGHYLGKCVHQFIQTHQLKNVQFVASHGQTIFHNPQKSYTIQIGSGASLAKECGLPVVCDFRTTDMAYGGQGAPLVPLGERDLFPTMQQFINIGGITNISSHNKEAIIGYDVCMGNLLLNSYANELGLPYDNKGEQAQKGEVNTELLQRLNQSSFFTTPPPKSLDAEQTIQEFLPITDSFPISINNKLRTLVEHIAIQLGKVLQPTETLLTGGGALNTFLVHRIQANTKATIVVPKKEIIEYKEALIFAYLGLMRLKKQANALASVTGAQKDTINGAVYLP